MNTGVQRSGATPPAARTATTAGRRRRARQRLRPGQERAADRDGARDPLRGHGDGRRPARPRGQGRAGDGAARRALPARARAPARSAGAARRATRSGSRGWPRRPACSRSSRPSAARSTAVTKIRRRVPVEEYLRPQKRSRTCSSPSAATDVIARIQAQRRPQHRAASGCSRRCDGHDKPFAITLDVGSSLANKTGSWRTERPRVRRPPPPCGARLPGRRGPPGVALPRRGGRLRGRLAARSWRTTRCPAIMGRVCYHPCETACNRAQLDEAVGINSVERFLGDEAIRAGLDGRRRSRRRPASACSSSAPGPSGPVGRLPPRAARPRGRRSTTPGPPPAA